VLASTQLAGDRRGRDRSLDRPVDRAPSDQAVCGSAVPPMPGSASPRESVGRTACATGSACRTTVSTSVQVRSPRPDDPRRTRARVHREAGPTGRRVVAVQARRLSGVDDGERSGRGQFSSSSRNRCTEPPSSSPGAKGEARLQRLGDRIGEVGKRRAVMAKPPARPPRCLRRRAGRGEAPSSALAQTLGRETRRAAAGAVVESTSESAWATRRAPFRHVGRADAPPTITSGSRNDRYRRERRRSARCRRPTTPRLGLVAHVVTVVSLPTTG
jgi:hypothetical protein